MPTIVLASTSKYRIELMNRLGVEFLSVAHRCDERAAEPKGATPEEIASFLAREKAESLANVHPEAIVIGSDQVVEVDGEILGKPGSQSAACAQLRRLSGRMHRIVTAVSVREPSGAHHTHVDVHRMHVRELSAAAIERYVAVDQPLDCAGSYKLEGRGIVLFSSIEGDDHTAIVGLPLIAVVTLLQKVGIDVLEAC